MQLYVRYRLTVDGRVIWSQMSILCFNNDWLLIDKALGNFRESDTKNKDMNNVRSAWGPFPGPTTVGLGSDHK